MVVNNIREQYIRAERSRASSGAPEEGFGALRAADGVVVELQIRLVDGATDPILTSAEGSVGRFLDPTYCREAPAIREDCPETCFIRVTVGILLVSCGCKKKKGVGKLFTYRQKQLYSLGSSMLLAVLLAVVVVKRHLWVGTLL